MNKIKIKLTEDQVAALRAHIAGHPMCGLLAQPHVAHGDDRDGVMEVTIVLASQVSHVSWMLEAIWMHRDREQAKVAAAMGGA